MSRIYWIIWWCCCLPLGLWAAKVDSLLIDSPLMEHGVKVVIISPDKATSEACPTLYLLHGHSGNEKTWLVIKPNLPEIVDEKGLIVVCPDGENSWYWDSPLNANVRYETFISDELVRYVDGHYNTIADRRGRAIAGLSMGGHGALWNAIRHSDVFSAAGSMSGGLDIRPFPKNWNMSDQLGDQSTHPDNWESHTVINLVPRMEKGRLAIIVDCGEEDFFLKVNKAFHEALLKKGIDHDFITRPGAHNNAYWGNSIDYQILFFMKHFSRLQTEKDGMRTR